MKKRSYVPEKDTLATRGESSSSPCVDLDDPHMTLHELALRVTDRDKYDYSEFIKKHIHEMDKRDPAHSNRTPLHLAHPRFARQLIKCTDEGMLRSACLERDNADETAIYRQAYLGGFKVITALFDKLYAHNPADAGNLLHYFLARDLLYKAQTNRGSREFLESDEEFKRFWGKFSKYVQIMFDSTISDPAEKSISELRDFVSIKCRELNSDSDEEDYHSGQVGSRDAVTFFRPEENDKLSQLNQRIDGLLSLTYDDLLRQDPNLASELEGVCKQKNEGDPRAYWDSLMGTEKGKETRHHLLCQTDSIIEERSHASTQTYKRR